jgi:hypothetical protein
MQHTPDGDLERAFSSGDEAEGLDAAHYAGVVCLECCLPAGVCECRDEPYLDVREI